MKQKRRDDLIYALVLIGACSLAVGVMALATWIDRVLP
jgi:hypothetical protein